MAATAVSGMMLNRGVFGGKRFLTPEAYDAMMPTSLRTTIGLDVECGLSISKLYRDMPGMGGASGASVRWSPKHELVIAICRFQTDPDHGKNVERLVDAIVGPLETPAP